MRRTDAGRRFGSAAALTACLVTVLGLLAAAVVRAGEAGTTWQPAPIQGGDVRSLAIHPHDPDTIVAGTASGQIYVSRDGGERWRPPGGLAAFPGWVVTALQFDPNRPDRLWAGFRGVWGDGLVARSDDLGESWTPRVGDLPDLPVYALALVPGREGRLYAGTLDGVWASGDGGETWRKRTGELAGLAKVASLLVPPEEPDAVIAGTWRRAYKSEDAGRTWQGVFDGMYLDSEVFTLVPTRRPGEVWASTCNWVYRSLDGGESWERYTAGMDERRATAFGTLPWGRLLSGTVAGLYVSDDRGESWQRSSPPDLSIQAIAHHPGRPARVFFGTQGAGVWVSEDGGDTVRRAGTGMTGVRVVDVVAAGGEILAAVAHSGPVSGIHVSTDGGATFPERIGDLPPILDLAAGPALAGTGTEAAGGEEPVDGRPRIWAATVAGLFERRSGGWKRVAAFGEDRVEAVSARDGRVLVRTGEGVWEVEPGGEAAGEGPGDVGGDDEGEDEGRARSEAGARGPRFVPTAYSHGPPRSATLRGDEIWVTDADGLYRVAEGSNHVVAAPFPAGSVSSLGDVLLYAGKEGAWARGGGEDGGAWRPVVETGRARVLETGDPEVPAVLVVGDAVRPLRRDGTPAGELALAVPGRFVRAALVHDGHLYLATGGFGLLRAALPEDTGPTTPL